MSWFSKKKTEEVYQPPTLIKPRTIKAKVIKSIEILTSSHEFKFSVGSTVKGNTIIEIRKNHLSNSVALVNEDEEVFYVLEVPQIAIIEIEFQSIAVDGPTE